MEPVQPAAFKSTPDAEQRQIRLSWGQRWGDRGFGWLLLAAAIALLLLLAAITVTLLQLALPALQRFGLGFLTGAEWNPVTGSYGILTQLYGTLLTSLLALGLAVPLGLGVAIFLSEDFLPPAVRGAIALLVELLAAIPSVVYGLWGLFVLVPALLPLLGWLHQLVGWLPLFGTPPTSRAVLPTAIVLALMILPILISLGRETLLALPSSLRQGSMALGATRWETILYVLLPAAGSGIGGAVMLALGRALGETMAAAMLIGNANRISPSLLAPGSTIAALIANQFGASSGLQQSALLYAALVLMLLTLLVNAIAHQIIRRAPELP